jgi:RNA polymerase sigma-70 factor (ECF subfamily)
VASIEVVAYRPVTPGADSIPAAAMRDLPDAELVRRLADRRQEALVEIHERFAPLLLAVVRRILGNGQDAEEVVQEAFLQAWTQAARYDARRASVPTWLVLMARSRAIDLLRSRRVRERTLESVKAEPAVGDASPDGPASVWYGERQQRVAGALAALPTEQREVLEKAFYEGLSQSEIAAQTGIPLGTVKTRTLLAMRKLREALRDEMRELL